MSIGTFLLFFAGLIILWVTATVIGRRLTEGDKFEEETVVERVAHLEQRLYTHRKWWQTGIVVGVLVSYVMVVGMFFTQNVAEDLDRQARLREQQAEVQRIENQCQFRDFVQEFFTQLGENQFSVGDIENLEGYDILEPGARLFVQSLAIAIAENAITIQEAREAYIDTFPTDQCD